MHIVEITYTWQANIHVQEGYRIMAKDWIHNRTKPELIDNFVCFVHTFYNNLQGSFDLAMKM